MSELFAALRELNLPAGDYAVFGSGPLAIRGIIDRAEDLDVLCRGSAWTQVRQIGQIEYLQQYQVEIVSIGEQLTFGQSWGIGNFDCDELIDQAEWIEDLPFVPLRYVIEYKQLRDSSKDRAHLAALAAAS